MIFHQRMKEGAVGVCKTNTHRKRCGPGEEGQIRWERQFREWEERKHNSASTAL